MVAGTGLATLLDGREGSERTGGVGGFGFTVSTSFWVTERDRLDRCLGLERRGSVSGGIDREAEDAAEPARVLDNVEIAGTLWALDSTEGDRGSSGGVFRRCSAFFKMSCRALSNWGQKMGG